MAESFLWYDLETFGTDSRWDRIAQFAAIRTTPEFEEIGEPIVFYGRISPDYLPHPEACLVTGLTPKRTAEGMVEPELAHAIAQHMSVPNTCSVGYNSLRFDDEFIRNLFYRNFIDPYRREWAQGNSRWDILPLARMAHDLRPAGIEWPQDDGRPSFRLERITAANGIEHSDAHDALADVRATIELARLIKTKQPKLYSFYYDLRRKDAARRVLNLQHPQPVLLSDPLFTRDSGTTGVVYPIAAPKDRSNEVIAMVVDTPIPELAGLSEEELRQRIFIRQSDDHNGQRISMVRIATNKAPALAPLSILGPDDAERLGIDPGAVAEHVAALSDRLRDHPTIAQRIRSVFSSGPQSSYQDPDLSIYAGGFFGDQDRRAFQAIHATEPAALLRLPPTIIDVRGSEMLFRYVARNYPEVLDPESRKRWLSHCAGRLLAPEYEGALDVQRFRTMVANLLHRVDVTPRDKTILKDLKDYGDWIERHILSEG